MENTRVSESFAEPDGKSVLLGRTRVVGNISGPGDVLLDGEIEGDVAVAGLLFIGESGSVRGQISAGNLVLAGEIRGRVKAAGRVEVRCSGRLVGDIVCQKIAIAEGAFLDGKVHTHKGQPLAPEVFTEKRQELQAAIKPGGGPR